MRWALYVALSLIVAAATAGCSKPADEPAPPSLIASPSSAIAPADSTMPAESTPAPESDASPESAITLEPPSMPAELVVGEVSEDEDGLRGQIESVFASLEESDRVSFLNQVDLFRVPDSNAWFLRVFGPDAGAPAAAAYMTQVESWGHSLGQFFLGEVKKGRTEVHVHKLTGADDPEATGLQQAALAAMIEPVELYTVDFVEPGKDTGESLWSFCYEQGAFRLVGKLKELPSALE